jgi:hypothetical protein
MRSPLVEKPSPLGQGEGFLGQRHGGALSVSSTSADAPVLAAIHDATSIYRQTPALAAMLLTAHVSVRASLSADKRTAHPTRPKSPHHLCRGKAFSVSGTSANAPVLAAMLLAARFAVMASLSGGKRVAQPASSGKPSRT